MKPNNASQLCLECGLCCNGVIFANGQLQPGDDAARLKALGLRFSLKGRAPTAGRKFLQPCAAFDGSRCNIYCERPQYCREFECLVLKNAQTGRLELKAARRVVRLARQRAETVKRLLRELGDADEQTALSVRFRRVKRRVETGVLDENTADLFGQLTLAVHDLNLLLSDAFYPGAG
jgi:uncharacterized protein